MLGFFEICIRSRLLPYNENHAAFFARLELPVRITDRALAPDARYPNLLLIGDGFGYFLLLTKEDN